MTYHNSSPSDTTSDVFTIERVRDDVNHILRGIFTERRATASLLSPRYAALWEATETYVLSGGKRIRPYLSVLGYQLFGGSAYEKILYVATAQELLNQALLMHDDIIDRDFVRYGIPNVAGQFRTYYQNERGYSDLQSRHYANAAAMLAGDLCISEAFLVIRQAGFSPEQTAVLQDFLHEGMFTVAGGELFDSETYNAGIVNTDPMIIAHHKTAIYSVVIPLLSGASVAGASDEDLVSLRKFGEKLGVAYQLADDLLGVFGNAGVTGKTTIGDLREGKHTFMMRQTWLRASDKQHQVLDRLFGKPDLTQDEADEIRTIIIASGAKQEVNETIDTYVSEAISNLDSVTATEERKRVLRAFCLTATKREK